MNILFSVYYAWEAIRQISQPARDIVFLIDYLYFQPETPPPVPSAIYDINGDETVNIFDISYLINFLYLGGTEPVCNGLPCNLNRDI